MHNLIFASNLKRKIKNILTVETDIWWREGERKWGRKH